MEQTGFLDVGTGPQARRIAWRCLEGAGPTLVWLGGFRSDMTATKASRIVEWGESAGRSVLRFDYSGHGASGGSFEEGTIGRWLEESLAVIRAHAGEKPILVGSSMGGWMALLVARALQQEGRALGGLVLIAPAPDFTETLMWDTFADHVREAILTEGRWMHLSEYSPEPYAITRELIEEGRNHLLLGKPIRIGAPVRILQGMKDPDVPWQHAMALVEHLAEDDVVVTLIRDGDHRLSRPEDLERLVDALANFRD